MEHQSGVTPGGDGRVREAFGDRGSGANFFSEVNSVGGNGGGDTAMAIGGNSNREMDDGSGVHDTASVNGRGVVAHCDAIASTDAFGLQAPSGGFGRSSEAGEGAARDQGAQVQTLEKLMATILRIA